MISSTTTSDLTDAKLNKEDQRWTSSSRRCPSCGHELDCNPDMVGFPAGVKFDPSDQELIEHLESLVKEGGSRAHPLLDEFIPTIQGDDGICYTRPENLPGVTRDGLSKHFFHRPSKAYTTGTRKRRKILSERGLHSSEDVVEARWHKTGKTRPVIVGGRQKGCKKILVLYTNYGKQGKPEKTNWVMHQYHLGSEEKDGELVVSKVFYQTQLRSAVAVIEQNDEKDEKVEVTSDSEATPNMLPVCDAAATAAAVDTMVKLQQHQRQRQTNSQCKFAPAMSEEVGVGNPVSGDQGQLHSNYHIASQHVQSVHGKSAATMSIVVSTALNTESTKVSQHASGLLNNGIQFQTVLRQNEKQQDQQQQQKNVVCRRSCSLEGAMVGCQTTIMEEDASTQPKEIQRLYQCWPPDRHQDG